MYLLFDTESSHRHRHRRRFVSQSNTLAVALVVLLIALRQTLAVERHELQARCAARCLVYTPDNRGAFGTYGRGPNFNACIFPCAGLPLKTQCQQICIYQQANCSSTCLFLDRIRSQGDSVATPIERLPAKIDVAPSFDNRTLYLSWSVNRTALYGISFVVQFVAVARAQATNATFVEALTWTTLRPTFYTDENVANIVSTPDPSRLYLFRVGVYNEFGTRGFSDAWSAPLNLSLYYRGDPQDVDPQDPQDVDPQDVDPQDALGLNCSGTYGRYPKMPANLTRVGEMKIEANDSVAFNVSWNPPPSGIEPSCYEIAFKSRATKSCRSIEGKYVVPASRRQYELEGLQRECEYAVWVMSLPGGVNETTAPLIVDIPGDSCVVQQTGVRLSPRNVTVVSYALDVAKAHFVVNVSWLCPVNCELVSGYELTYDHTGGSGSHRHGSSVFVNQSDDDNGYFSETVSALEPNSYRFTVKAKTTIGCLSLVETKADSWPIVLPPIWAVILRIDAVAIGKDVRVAWHVSKSHFKVTSYRLLWGVDATNGTSNSTLLSPTITSYVLTGLVPDTEYYVKVKPNGLGKELGTIFTSPSDSPTVDTRGARTSVLIFATVLPIVLVLVIVVVLFFFLYFCRERFERKSRLSITSSTGLTSAAAATELFFRRDSGPLWINPEPSDDWEIDPKLLRLNKILQEGEHGIVLKGQLTTRRQSVRLTKRQGSILRDVTVACKIPKVNGPREQRDFLEEIKLMKTVGQNTHIVSLVGCLTQRAPLCLVVEYCPGGDLLTFLRRSRSTLLDKRRKSKAQILDCDDNPDGSSSPVKSSDFLSFAWQISSGMNYLSGKGVVHRDLACRNVLVMNDHQLKVADFGLARAVNDDGAYSQQSRRRLPLRWMAIEAIENRVFTEASDVWSFGVVLWEICTLGRFPYPSMSGEDFFTYLRQGNRLDKPTNCSDELYSIMMECWLSEPYRRPRFSDLVVELGQMLEAENPNNYFDLDDISYLSSLLAMTNDDVKMDEADGDLGCELNCCRERCEHHQHTINRHGNVICETSL